MINFSELTKRQQQVLGEIAINQDGGHPRSTLESLVRRGLIERYAEPRGIVTIYRYRVPIPVHMAWCEWCSEQQF